MKVMKLYLLIILGLLLGKLNSKKRYLRFIQTIQILSS